MHRLRASGLQLIANYDGDEQAVFPQVARKTVFRLPGVCKPFFSMRNEDQFVEGVTGLYYDTSGAGRAGPFFGDKAALNPQKPTVDDAVAEAAAHYLANVKRYNSNLVIYEEVKRRLEEHTDARAKHVAAARLDFLRRVAVGAVGVVGTTALALTTLLL